MFRKIIAAVFCMGILSCCFAQSGDSTLAQLVTARSGGTKYIGTVIEYDSFSYSNPQIDTIKKQFNIITNQLIKMTHCHLDTNYTFSYCDSVDTFAHVNNLKERGHALIVPDETIPTWLLQVPDSLQKWARLKSHVDSVMHRYRGRFCDVNVVNEALEWGVDTFDTQPLKAGPDYAGGFYYRHFGPYYIDSVFKWAHAADPNAKLYYNDDLIENINNRSNVLYKLVKQWLGRGVFINGIGFETHLSPDQNDSIWDTINYQSFKQNIARFTALGLDVQITELDVRLNLANVRMNSDTEYAKQGHIYAELARIFLSEPRCRGFVMWGICDTTSWINEEYGASGLGSPCIYNALMQHKPAYDSLYKAIKEFSTTQKIPLGTGWSIISLNVRPFDSTTTNIFGPVSHLVLAKNNAGQCYWRTRGDTIVHLLTGQGYQVYVTADDTIRATGSLVNVASTPIGLAAGWNMIGYLPQVDMPATTALAGIVSNMLIAKNNDGGVYCPEYGVNTLDSLHVNEGYQVYMNTAATLTYPSGLAKRNGVFNGYSLPKCQHFALKLHTGISATLLTKAITINNIPISEGSEMGVYDSKNNLVGSGGIRNGMTAFTIWGDDSLTQAKDGCTASELLTFKLWYNNREYTLTPDSTVTRTFSKNAIITGSFSVSSKVVVSAFALAAAYPNPFRSSIKIAFEVPSVSSGAEQQVEINVYDLKGSVVRKLVNSKYAAGRYTINWNGAGEHGEALSSSMYIVQMKADNFSKKLKLFRLR